MPRVAVINEETKIVHNIIELEDDNNWEVPVGFYIVKTDLAFIGGLHKGDKFVEPTSNDD